MASKSAQDIYYEQLTPALLALDSIQTPVPETAVAAPVDGPRPGAACAAGSCQSSAAAAAEGGTFAGAGAGIEEVDVPVAAGGTEERSDSAAAVPALASSSQAWEPHADPAAAQKHYHGCRHLGQSLHWGPCTALESHQSGGVAEIALVAGDDASVVAVVDVSFQKQHCVGA